jgi:uncharacterized protein YcaQ
MAKANPPTEIVVSKEQARRFMVEHQRLAPPRKLRGKQGILDFVRHVNCIQYDPINLVGQNSHLVLQSRIKDYKPSMLDEALYKERKLVDGFDKVMSIFPTEDWHYFSGYRKRLSAEYFGSQATDVDGTSQNTSMIVDPAMIKWVRKELTARGPLSSLDLENNERMMGWWGANARVARVALDIMFLSGEIVVHHRVGTRRYFDLASRLMKNTKKDPNRTAEAYLDWHVLRRIQSAGLIRPGEGSAQWVGIQRRKSHGGGLQAALKRLEEQGKILRVAVEGVPGKVFVTRRDNLPALEKAAKPRKVAAGAAFIAPLDNLMWDRDLLEQVFDFYYRWEVYVPEPKRVWGYYVLPVLYGNRLVARMDPGHVKTTGAFTIKNWWWEKGVDKNDEEMLAALQESTRAFAKYLNAKSVTLGEKAKKDKVLKELVRGL